MLFVTSKMDAKMSEIRRTLSNAVIANRVRNVHGLFSEEPGSSNNSDETAPTFVAVYSKRSQY